MNKQEYMSILVSEAKEPAYLYAVFSGRASGIVIGVGSNDDKIAELKELVDALEEVEEMLLTKYRSESNEDQSE